MKMKTMRVLLNTRLKDIKVGDLVITAELHRVTAINKPWYVGSKTKKEDKTVISVVSVKPRCGFCRDKGKRKCCHEYMMEIGWGQHNIAKVLK